MPCHRRVKRLHVPATIMARLFELPKDAEIAFAGFAGRDCVLFVESEEFERVKEFEIPPKMPLKLRLHQWTSEFTKHSDTHYSVKITHGTETHSKDFHGESAAQQAEIYHIAQRQRAGLL